MIRRNAKRQQRKIPRHRSATAWLGVLLILFSVFNGATMGLRSMAAQTGGTMPLCPEHNLGVRAHHHPSPAHPASSDSCSCCLSMCCSGATLPDDAPPAPAPALAWTFLDFRPPPAFPPQPEPQIGGQARAPPARA